jgi:RNA polymerase sigma factor (sigma-70 family)
VDGSRERVTAVVARMVGREEAEDVVQEALLHAYLGLSRLREPARFTSWLCAIAVNLAKMRLRSRGRRPELLGLRDNAGAPAEDRELLELVRDAVELLPGGQRDVVLMHYVDGLSCAEIASVLGSSPGAVRARLHRARAQLRTELADVSIEPSKPEKEAAMVAMQVQDVVVRVARDDPSKLVWDGRIIVLAGRDDDRVLPIWIGGAEGNALAAQLTSEAPPRPTTSDLAAELLRVTGGRVEQVAVTVLREKTFLATVTVAVDGRTEQLDARPSDAINLAVRSGAPIFVAEELLEGAPSAAQGTEALLEREGDEAGVDIPDGEWASLSAELLRSLHERRML